MSDLKSLACKAIDAATADLKEVSKKIYDNPELCFEEHHAHKVLTDCLEKYGFDVERHYILETAFRASYGDKANGPHIVVLCEYDALPGIGHACGHNLIAEVGLAAGIGAKAAMDTYGKLFGKLTVLGSPAEEGGGGKIDQIRAGVFNDVDVAMMAHPSQFNLAKPIMVALNLAKITYRGKSAHAASYPWEGVNALDAAVLCYQNLSCMRQQMKPTWRVHGVITNGGLKPNIIPEETTLEYFIRAPSDGELSVLQSKFTTCVEAAAVATGCTVDIKFDDKPYAALMSNNLLASLYEENGHLAGVTFNNDVATTTKQGGSTDMGNVSTVVPSIHPKFYITKASGHSLDFAKAACTEESQVSALATGKTIAMTAVDLFLKPSLVTQIKEEFKQSALQQKC